MCKKQDFLYPMGTCNELGNVYEQDKILTVSSKKKNKRERGFTGVKFFPSFLCLFSLQK